MVDTTIDGAGNVRTYRDDPGTGLQPKDKSVKSSGVRTQHPDYTRMCRKWQRCRDVSLGQDAVHDAGQRYLARLTEQTPTEYMAMVERTPFYNATWRTIAGLNGMLFRKLPIVEVPPSVEPLLDNVTGDGVPIHIFAATIGEEALTVGRVGIMTDYPQVDVKSKTQADVKAEGIQPTMAMYRAETIINWKPDHGPLTMVVLKEDHHDAVDEFGDAVEERYRVLDFGDAGKYRQRMYRINERNEDEQVGGDVYPLMGNAPLDFIPFKFIGPDSTTPEVDDPPLIDLVNMNISHYKVTADYEHGCHFVGLPTPCIAGYRKETPEEKIYVGGTSCLVFPAAEATWGYLEFSGAGLGELGKNLEQKEQRMAVLGARMLEQMKKGVESAQTAGIHRVGEQSMLASVSQSISLGMTEAVQWYCAWAGAPDDEASIEINRDFFPEAMTAQMLTALVTTWQQGAISYPTLFAAMKAGDMVDQDKTAEEEQAEINDSPPLAMLGQMASLDAQQQMTEQIAAGNVPPAGPPAAAGGGKPKVKAKAKAKVK